MSEALLWIIDLEKYNNYITYNLLFNIESNIYFSAKENFLILIYL